MSVIKHPGHYHTFSETQKKWIWIMRYQVQVDWTAFSCQQTPGCPRLPVPSWRLLSQKFYIKPGFHVDSTRQDSIRSNRNTTTWDGSQKLNQHPECIEVSMQFKPCWGHGGWSVSSLSRNEVSLKLKTARRPHRTSCGRSLHQDFPAVHFHLHVALT